MVDKYHILTPRDQETLSTARMGTRMGFGKRIAVIVIDAQVYMIGDRCEPMSESNKRYPSSCGDIGWKACENGCRTQKGHPHFLQSDDYGR